MGCGASTQPAGEEAQLQEEDRELQAMAAAHDAHRRAKKLRAEGKPSEADEVEKLAILLEGAAAAVPDDEPLCRSTEELVEMRAAADGEPLMAGRMEKLGPNNIFWQTRYFELVSDQLMWFANEPSDSAGCRPVKCEKAGALELRKFETRALASAELCPVIERQGRYISIPTQGEGRTYLMRAATDESALQWCTALHQAWSSADKA